MMPLAAFIEGMPKAELHMHIEGSFEPELMFEIAARNDILLPYKTVDALRDAYKFKELKDFLNIYYQGASALRTEQDFYDLTYAYLKRARAQNVLHAELFFDPQTHTARGVPFAVVVEGIHRALLDGEATLGITSALILCFLRHLDQDGALATLDAALDYKDRIIAIGLDSTERGNPPTKFRDAFRRARDEGFRLVCHAGEEGPADYVRQAVDELGVDRIDHGNRAMDDASLVDRLAAMGMPLTVCPLSNLKLCGVKRMEDHPLKAMMDSGLMVTVNSDDPAYFGGYVNENYTAVTSALGLGQQDVIQLARNSFEASFVDPDRKAALIGRVEAFAAAH